MSPFDLRGPEFLWFYLFVGALILVALSLARRFVEPTEPIKADLSDPYMIAFLRGGQNELLRVCTISLIHRGLLKVEGTNVSLVSSQAADGVRDPLERQLLLFFRSPKEASSVFSGLRSSLDVGRYVRSLENLGLLPNGGVRIHRAAVIAIGLIVLWGLALIKINVALARGHTNIGFLVILAVVFGFLTYKLVFPRLTIRGKAMLQDLRLLFARLKDRPASSLTANDVPMLAAVFGFAALPAAAFPYAQTLYPKAAAVGGDSSSSCGSTSCGSSGGDGGGGGCGGGCGGCGS